MFLPCSELSARLSDATAAVESLKNESARLQAALADAERVGEQRAARLAELQRLAEADRLAAEQLRIEAANQKQVLQGRVDDLVSIKA
jgi:hypothetical protein